MPDSALFLQLRRSAETVGLRGGHLVPLRYGSAAGELAVCLRSVGLVDREDLRVLTVSGEPEAIDRLTAGSMNGGLATGEAATVDRAHWGRLDRSRALVALPATSAPALREELLRLRIADQASVEESELQAIGVIGPATADLLTELGVYRALAGANGRGRIAIGPAADAAAWMLLDASSALALVEPEQAVELWNAMSIAGRRFGLGYVGAEAAERFEAVRLQSGDRLGH